MFPLKHISQSTDIKSFFNSYISSICVFKGGGEGGITDITTNAGDADGVANDDDDADEIHIHIHSRTLLK